jgi:sugar lactone lactonase YvrE
LFIQLIEVNNMKKRLDKTKCLVVSSIILLMLLSFVPSCGGGRGGSSGTINVSPLAGSSEGFGHVDGTGAEASFYNPSGITADGTDLYIADSGNSTIRKIVISTGAVTTIAGTAGITGHADGTGAVASFFNPYGIAADGKSLYVADSGNNTIRKIVISSGEVMTSAGRSGIAGHADKRGDKASFNSPFGLTTDGTNLYIADTWNNAIRKIVIATGAVTTIAGTAGTTGHADGTGAAASFFNPYGITTDGANLYVADYGNSTIRKIVIATGAVTTLAGTAGIIGHADGTGAAVSFYNPSGLTADGTSLYVADSGNNTIRKIVIATGAVTTVAGTAGITGHADGTGAAASFYYPWGIVTDGTKLYVTDNGNSTIRKIETATGAVTTLAGTARVTGHADGAGAVAIINNR